MGTAHVLMHPEFICQLVERFQKDISITEMSDWGDGMAFCRIRTRLLEKGYHGVVAVSVVDGRLRIRPERDI